MAEARERVRQHFGADLSELQVIRHGRELSGGLAGLFQKERYVVEVESPLTDPSPESVAAPTRVRASKATGASSHLGGFDALIESARDSVGISFDDELRSVLSDAEATVSGAPEAAPLLCDERSSLASLVDDATEALVAAPARRGPFGVASEMTRMRFVSAGVPDEYVPDTPLAFPARLAQLAKTAPVALQPGEVLLLVGDIDRALAIAERECHRLELDDAILVVSSKRIPASVKHARARTPEEAGAVVLDRRLERQPTVAVLDASTKSDFMLRSAAGIHPKVVWGVVPASWDERQVRLLEGFVGKLDALALHSTLLADRPAGLIGRHWPIAYVDGWEATPLSISARIIEAIGFEL